MENFMPRLSGLRSAIPAILVALLVSACDTMPTKSGPVVVPVRPVETPAVSPRIAAAATELSRMAAMQDRLYRVAAPLMINNADLCKTFTRNLLGFTARNRYWYPGEYNEASGVAFGMGERLQVTGVLVGSGAARSGLRRGDQLVSAGGKALPKGPKASNEAGAVFGPLVAAQATLPLVVERNNAERELTIPVTRACGFGIELGNADNINSYADGQRILVTRGMMNFADSDEELAVLIAKGMAHNILGHATTTRSGGTIGSVIDNLVRVRPDTSMLIGSSGIKAMPAELDAAADSLSMFLLARANYRVETAAPFWRRLEKSYPSNVLNAYVANHPATTARLAAIDKAIADIKSRGSKKNLLP